MKWQKVLICINFSLTHFLPFNRQFGTNESAYIKISKSYTSIRFIRLVLIKWHFTKMWVYQKFQSYTKNSFDIDMQHSEVGLVEHHGDIIFDSLNNRMHNIIIVQYIYRPSGIHMLSNNFLKLLFGTYRFCIITLNRRV